MPKPSLSTYFAQRGPSPVRLAQIECAKRTDGVRPINAAIGDVTLPMHPAMQKRLKELGTKSPFAKGVDGYAPTVGVPETRNAFLHVINSFGFNTNNLYCNITEGGSAAMEITLLGTTDPERPVLLLDPAYPNYKLLAKRTCRRVVSVCRTMNEDGVFSLPDFKQIEATIKKEKPAALVVIPYDNPTGQFYPQEELNELARLCVKYGMWIISDEAYRGLVYTKQKVSSVWAITEKEVLGISGCRISIESTSKVWNACGLRIGAIITDNKEFHEKAVAECTATLGSNSIGQYIFAGILNENKQDLEKWYAQQRAYYSEQMHFLRTEFLKRMPKLIVSQPQSALYMVVDMRNVDANFDSTQFVLYCAREGSVVVGKENVTLLTAPMEGFYTDVYTKNPGKTQLRIAFVVPAGEMKLVPELFVKLVEGFRRKVKT
ncbi:pyridoxal phosphate-dependent aminotransferase [Candidatus Woesearchaeota archaeon]|nr:pyridoxal phosphate-dependent aminotransferase [Candidatus Woesearchaeota archaeon]